MSLFLWLFNIKWHVHENSNDIGSWVEWSGEEKGKGEQESLLTGFLDVGGDCDIEMCVNRESKAGKSCQKDILWSIEKFTYYQHIKKM